MRVLFEPTLATIDRKQDLKCSRECYFAVSFMHLQLREFKEDYTKVGESKAEIEL